MTSNSDSEELQAFKADSLNDLMLEFVLTGNKEAFASYLERGGHIDEETKTRLLMDLLNGCFRPNNKGGRNDYKSLKIYLKVRLLMFQKCISKTAACALYAETIDHKEARTIELQFAKGEQIASSVFGKSSDKQ